MALRATKRRSGLGSGTTPGSVAAAAGQELDGSAAVPPASGEAPVAPVPPLSAPEASAQTAGERAIAAAVADVIHPAHESHPTPLQAAPVQAEPVQDAPVELDPVSPAEHVEMEAAVATEELVEAASKATTAVSEAAAGAFAEARDHLRAIPVEPVGFEPFRIDPAILPDKVGAEFVQASRMVTEFNTRVMEVWRSNAEAMMAHMTTLAGVRSVSEAIALNSEFARKQIETLNAQSRELAGIASRGRREG